MKSAHRYFRFTALSAALVTIAVACAEADVTVGTVDEVADAADAAVVIPEDDAGSAEADAGADADAASDVVVPERTCTDEGWCHTNVPDAQTLRGVWDDGQGVAWTVSEQGKILRWDGAQWVTVHDAGVPLYAVWGSSPTDIWVGGGVKTTGNQAPGILLHGTGSSPANLVWTAIVAPLTVRSIWGSSATDIYAALSLAHRVRLGDPGFVLHYSGPPANPPDPPADGDAGITGTGWEIDPLSSQFQGGHFEKVWGTGPDDVWIAGRMPINTSTGQGLLLRRGPDGDGGVDWRRESPTTPVTARVDLYGMSVSPTLVFVVGFTGVTSSPYFHTGVRNADGVTYTWTETQAAATGFVDNALSTLWASAANAVWIAGQRGRIRRWDGTKWQIEAVSINDAIPMQQPIYSMWGSGPNDLWVVGAGVALHKGPPGN